VALELGLAEGDVGDHAAAALPGGIHSNIVDLPYSTPMPVGPNTLRPEKA
jgi:hypothetical protein